jgi:hypothetical protein
MTIEIPRLQQRYMLGPTPEDIFAINPKVRWVGMATSKGKVIFNQMRPGIESVTPTEDDRLLLELRAQYITETSRQSSVWAGPVEYIAISYEKFLEVTITLIGKIVIVTLERNASLEDVRQIVERIRNMTPEHSE